MMYSAFFIRRTRGAAMLPPQTINQKRRLIMFDEKLTAHLAELSKLEFSDDELSKMTGDMTEIIALMDKVCDYDPTVKPYTLDSIDYKELRRDNYSDSYPSEKILENADITKNDSFVVPKVV